MRSRRLGLVVAGAAALSALVLAWLLPTARAPLPAPTPALPGEARGTAWDLVALVRGDAERPPGRQPVRQEAYGEVRAAIAASVPQEIAYPVAVPRGAVLDVGYAVQARPFLKDEPARAVPTRFRIVLYDAGGTAHALLDQVVDVRDRAADRRWFDARVDLGPYAGVRGRLGFSVTTEEAAPGPTIALLSAPRILTGPAPDDVNLLLVTIDCLRADHVGAYGYARPTTPTLDGLAAQGIRFAHAYSTAPMTLPSLPQLFTSTLFPAPGLATFLLPLNAAGIPSAAFVHNIWLVLWLEANRGPEAPDGFDTLVSVEARGSALTDRALAWLDRHPGDRFALYLHYLDAHSPFTPRPAYANLFRDPGYSGPVGATFDASAAAPAESYGPADRAAITALYDAGIRYVDDEIRRLLDALGRDGRLDHTLVVVTADHGEEFGEHGAFFHGQSLHDELLHVPLLVRLPGAARAGTVIERQVRAIDVAPAMLEWLGLPRPATFTGRSLAEAVAHPDGPPDELVATATMAQFPTRYALRTPGWKLIDDIGSGSSALYDLEHDPGEQRDVASEKPERAAALAGPLAAARAILRQRGFQLRIVGPDAGSASFRLRLTSLTKTETFATLDRTDGEPGAAVARLTPDGQGLEIEGHADTRGVGFRFDRPGNGPPGKAAEIEVALEVDGVPGGVDDVRLGADGHAPLGGRIVLDATVEATQSPPCPSPPAGVRVFLWRVPGRLAPAGPVVGDPAVRERLRALGYVQ